MSTPLRQLLSDILFDETARADFGADADAFLLDHGWNTLEGSQLEEALAGLSEAMPVETAREIESILEEVDFSGDSLASIGADLADATAQLTLDETQVESHTDNGAGLGFGTGADADTALVSHAETGDESSSDPLDDLGIDDLAEPETTEVDFDDQAEGIDSDVPLVHDIDGTDTSEIAFDLEETGIDDLDS